MHQLLDEETRERFGYAASDLSAGSHKKVMAQCSSCRQAFERCRKNVQEGWTCASCSQASVQARRHYSIEGLPIDVEATVQQLNRDPATLKPSSNRKVMIRCTTCSAVVPRTRSAVTADSKCLHHTFSSPEVTEKKMTTLKKRYGKDAMRGIAERRRATVRERYDGKPFAWNVKAESQAEKDIALLITSVLGEGATCKRVLPSGRHVDVFVPSKGVGIEFHGLHWHHERSPAPRDRAYHVGKWKEAASQGIRLIQVFEDEWRDRRAVVEQVILSALGVYGQRISASKCKVREVSKEEAREFMRHRHLQGASKNSIAAVGIFHKEKLVGAMTMSRHHRSSNEYAMDRLCFERGMQVVGGASRLAAALSKVARRHGATRLWTWSDNRWTNGSVYPRIGYVEHARTAPSYDYVCIANPKERISKQSMKKSATGCPSDVKESEWALQHGYARIWDCGKVTWRMDLT